MKGGLGERSIGPGACLHVLLTPSSSTALRRPTVVYDGRFGASMTRGKRLLIIIATFLVPILGGLNALGGRKEKGFDAMANLTCKSGAVGHRTKDSCQKHAITIILCSHFFALGHSHKTLRLPSWPLERSPKAFQTVWVSDKTAHGPYLTRYINSQIC